MGVFSVCTTCGRSCRLTDGRWLHVWAPTSGLTAHDAIPDESDSPGV